MRTNPKTNCYSGYYRLVESYRNLENKVCHRTILNAGYLDALNTDQLNLIQKIFTAKVNNHDSFLFELPYTDDAIIIKYVVHKSELDHCQVIEQQLFFSG